MTDNNAKPPEAQVKSNVVQLGQSRLTLPGNNESKRVPIPIQPSDFNINLVAEGTANWYTSNVRSMSIDTLRRHHSDLENQMAAYERGKLPLTRADRMEIVESLRVVVERMDELLPKVPAAIDAHDQFSGNRVHDNWPKELPQSTMLVHLHLCELIFAWRLNPNRVTKTIDGETVNLEVTIDEYAETLGKSRFVFGSRSDVGNFIDHYSLAEFVVVEPTPLGATDSAGHDFYYVELTNKFDRGDVNEFLKTYNAAMTSLAMIYEERRRAVAIDQGKMGFVHADYFTAREQIELNRVAAAREKLGWGFKLLNDLARK